KLVHKETANEKLLRRAMARIKAKINAEKEAREIKKDISNLVKDLHHMPKAVKKTPPAAAPVPVAAAADNRLRGQQAQGSSHAAMDKAKRQYYMAISRRIHDNWSLPEAQNWSPALEATIVIVVRRDGVVTRTFFEKKSANTYFDQYVEKTINDSTPMPAFPAAIREKQLEIGLRFRPSGMF
ncbi:MAG: TonB C-terminal domain-containing protein, partial [Deltaproteobacteria bacterium]|nr:TonB C-terminal domain-containing protein [Deltaproteobacteria bacterium]